MDEYDKLTESNTKTKEGIRQTRSVKQNMTHKERNYKTRQEVTKPKRSKTNLKLQVSDGA